MTDSDEVREKLEEIKREASGRRVGQIETIARLVSEALVLMGSEQGEQMMTDEKTERRLRDEIEAMRRAFVAIRKLSSEMNPSDPGKRNRRQGRLMKIGEIAKPFVTRMHRRNTMDPGPVRPSESEKPEAEDHG